MFLSIISFVFFSAIKALKRLSCYKTAGSYGTT